MSNDDLGPLYPSGGRGPVGERLLTNERLWHTAKRLEKTNKELQRLQAGIQHVEKTIIEANAKNDKLQTCLLKLAFVSGVQAIVQVTDILSRGIGR